MGSRGASTLEEVMLDALRPGDPHPLPVAYISGQAIPITCQYILATQTLIVCQFENFTNCLQNCACLDIDQAKMGSLNYILIYLGYFYVEQAKAQPCDEMHAILFCAYFVPAIIFLMNDLKPLVKHNASRVYMDTSVPIKSGRTAQSEQKRIIYTLQSEYNSLIGI